MTSSDRIRILIVENEGLVGCDMATSLGKFGHLVVGICASGEEALERFDELRPDLVLLDVHLAGQLDGIDTARELQRRSRVAIVYVTGCADLETVARARQTHPHGYLLKPFNHDELRLAVEVAAQRHLEENERQRREHSYFEAFQSLADGVIAADLSGGVVFINPSAARSTGWSAQEAVGRSLNEVFRIYQGTGEPAEMLPAESSATAERTVFLTTRSGERVAIQDRAAPLRDAQGQLSGVIILFRAVSPTPAPSSHPFGLPRHSSMWWKAYPTRSWPSMPVGGSLMPTPALSSSSIGTRRACLAFHSGTSCPRPPESSTTKPSHAPCCIARR